jgi:GNAT superfamily N-acetyltransferase
MSPSAHVGEASRSWSRDGFFISTDSSLIPTDALNKAFASDTLYWASPLPEPAMRHMLDNCLCFGLYSPTPTPPPRVDKDDDDAAAADPADTLHEIAGHVKPEASSRSHTQSTGQQVKDQAQQPSLIGFARLITDKVTFSYLTDVYVLPEWQGQGLGRWLISCVQEVCEEMPHLRRTMCIIGHGREKSLGFYGELVSLLYAKQCHEISVLRNADLLGITDEDGASGGSGDGLGELLCFLLGG